MRFIDCRLMEIPCFGIECGRQPISAIFYILKGSFTLRIDSCTVTVGPNDMVFFPSDMEFERHMIEPITFYNIRVDDYDSDLRGVVRPMNRIRLLNTLSYMTGLSTLGGSKALSDHYLRDIFVQLRTEEVLESHKDDGVVAKSIEYFEKNLASKISLEDVALSVGISPSGLIQHFNRYTGTTPIRYLNLMRVKRAEQLLCSSDGTLYDIAAECGFENSFYFSNVFKKEKGMSPREYRKNFSI